MGVAALAWYWHPWSPNVNSGLAEEPFDPSKIPLVTNRVRQSLANYAQEAEFKAIAISREGWGVALRAADVESAKREALDRCTQRDQKGFCRIYAVGDRVIWSTSLFPLPFDVRAEPLDDAVHARAWRPDRRGDPGTAHRGLPEGQGPQGGRRQRRRILGHRQPLQPAGGRETRGRALLGYPAGAVSGDIDGRLSDPPAAALLPHHCAVHALRRERDDAGRQAAHRANLRRQGLARARARRFTAVVCGQRAGLRNRGRRGGPQGLSQDRDRRAPCTRSATSASANAPIEHGQAPCRRSLLRCDHRRAGVFPVAARQAASLQDRDPHQELCRPARLSPNTARRHARAAGRAEGHLAARDQPAPARQRFGADVREGFLRPDQRKENTGSPQGPEQDPGHRRRLRDRCLRPAVLPRAAEPRL